MLSEVPALGATPHGGNGDAREFSLASFSSTAGRPVDFVLAGARGLHWIESRVRGHAFERERVGVVTACLTRVAASRECVGMIPRTLRVLGGLAHVGGIGVLDFLIGCGRMSRNGIRVLFCRLRVLSCCARVFVISV